MSGSPWLDMRLVGLLLVGGCSRRTYKSAARDWDDAVRDGNLGQVQALIARGANVNSGALPTPAARGRRDVVEVLIRCGAQIDRIDSQGRTPAVVAMQEDHRSIVEYLVSVGAAVNLHLAAYLGDTAKAQSLIDSGADVNARDGNGWMPLHYAASHGQREVARLLIAAGADPNAEAQDKHYPEDVVGGTALHLAVRGTDQKMIELLLKGGADVNARDKQGETPLAWAVDHNRLEAVKLLIAKGADVNARVQGGGSYLTTLLGIAVGRAHFEIMETLMAAGANVNARDGPGRTPLHLALTSEYRQVVEAAMSEYPDVTAPQTEWDRYRAQAGEVRRTLAVQIVRILCSHGADVNARDKEGITPLHWAAYHGARDVIELLMAQGADVNAPSRFDPNGHSVIWENRELRYRLGNGAVPLHAAVIRGHREAVEVLLAHGSQLDVEDKAGRTPLHHAAGGGKAEIVEFLLARGADVNAEDRRGATPLVDALLGGHVKAARALVIGGAKRANIGDHMVKKQGDQPRAAEPLLHRAGREWAELLLANGADPNERDDKGNTPLQAAILAGNEELAGLFVTHGTDVNAKSQGNLTALHQAANRGWAGFVSVLLAEGAEPNARDNDGDTPLHIAARRGHPEVVKLLVAHGADAGIKNSRGYTPLDEASCRGQRSTVEFLAARTAGTAPSLPSGTTQKL